MGPLQFSYLVCRVHQVFLYPSDVRLCLWDNKQTSAQRGCDCLLRFSQRTCSARPGELFTATGGVSPAIAPPDVILSHEVAPGEQLVLVNKFILI